MHSANTCRRKCEYSGLEEAIPEPKRASNGFEPALDGVEMDSIEDPPSSSGPPFEGTLHGITTSSDSAAWVRTEETNESWLTIDSIGNTVVWFRWPNWGESERERERETEPGEAGQDDA